MKPAIKLSDAFELNNCCRDVCICLYRHGFLLLAGDVPAGMTERGFQISG